MSRQSDRAFVAAVEWPDRQPDRHPDTLAWIARIEAVRRGVEVPTTRRCEGPCHEDLVMDAFTRDRGKPRGRRYICRACDAARRKAKRVQAKRDQFRAILGRAVAS